MKSTQPRSPRTPGPRGSSNQHDAAIPDFKDKVNVDGPALTYQFYLVVNHGPPEPWTYNLTRIIAAMVRNTGSPNTAFRIIHLKNSICKRLGVKFNTINLIYKNKILTDTENLFSTGIVDGARLHVIFKTDSRKFIEEEIMDKGPNSKKFLSQKERGKEKAPELSQREKAYQKGNFGLSDTKVSMLVNTMFDHPILTERYFENKLIYRILENHEMRDTIKEESEYFQKVLDRDPKLNDMLYGEGSRAQKMTSEIESARNFVAKKENIRNLTEDLNGSANNILKLCKHIQNPSKHSNPFPSGKGSRSGRAGDGMLSTTSNTKEWLGPNLNENDDGDAMFEADSDDDNKLYDGQTDMTDDDHHASFGLQVRADLKNVWQRYRDQYDYLKSMGLDDDQKILQVLKSVNGDLQAAINQLFPEH